MTAEKVYKTPESQRRAVYKYRALHLKRVPLDLQKEDYPALKTAADEAGESVQGYIKKAIKLRIMLGI